MGFSNNSVTEIYVYYDNLSTTATVKPSTGNICVTTLRRIKKYLRKNYILVKADKLGSFKCKNAKQITLKIWRNQACV